MSSRRLLIGGGGSVTFPFVGAGNLIQSGGVVTVDAGTGYKAFPGLCLTPNGRLLLVYRHGTSHAADNGYIAARFSDDGGLTWGSATNIYDPADDVRDPSLAVLSDDRIALSCFRYDVPTDEAYQCEVLFSSNNGTTWGSPVVVGKFYPTDTHTYEEAACSAPIVEVGSTLYLPVYMRDGTANWNAFAVPSVDNGVTFNNAVLMATGGAKRWTEPWITKLGNGDLLGLIRVDNLNQAWQAISTDDGATWPAFANVWAGDSRNATILTWHGALFTVGRNGGTQGQYGTSWDSATSWETRANLPSPSTNFQYAAIAQVATNRIVVVWSQQVSSSDADLYAQAFEDTGP